MKQVFAVVAGILLLIVVLLSLGSFKVVDPGNRGVRVTLGKVDPQFVGEGFTLKLPFVTTVHEVSIRQWTFPVDAACYSSDLQQLNIKLKVLYRAPESAVVPLYQQYQTDVFQTLVSPRTQEAMKEVTASDTADRLVKNREKIKLATLASARQKVGPLVQIDDIVIENIDLSDQLEQAIEQKMVQEQNASKAKFEQDRRKIDADTKVIEAKAEAESIRIQGEALKATPDLIQLKIVEKWDGRTPSVVTATTNPTGMMLPMPDRK